MKPFLRQGLGDLFADALVCSSDQGDLGGRCTRTQSDQTALPVTTELNKYNRRQENMSLVDSLKLYTPLTHNLVVGDALGCSLLVLVSIATVV